MKLTAIHPINKTPVTPAKAGVQFHHVQSGKISIMIGEQAE